MTLIFQDEFQRTLPKLIAQAALDNCSTVEAWTFDDQASRRAAEARLAEIGIKARFRSAYKPLLHFFLEDVDISTLNAITVVYPRHPDCSENRFLCETYPLAALVGETTLAFEAGECGEFTYRAILTDKNGISSIHSVLAPNRVHLDACGATRVSPTGWIRIGNKTDERLKTDYETVYEATLQAITSFDWGQTEPYFDELNLLISLPSRDCRLPIGEEVISLGEGMVEDLYFSLLEYFQVKSGRVAGDFTARPGQIVPEIRFAEQDAPLALRVEVRSLANGESNGQSQDLDWAERPISPDQIRAELASIAGEAFEAHSRSGRTINARYHKGEDRSVFISAGQHPNETTGIVGALRAARQLSARQTAHFVIAPLENPDGYELHARLRAVNPHYHHHAARYTAFGDELANRVTDPLFEKQIRKEAERRSGACLHLNLHGYSSHEWTRPLSGYLPRGFEKWAAPKGFFLIMVHHADWTVCAEQLIGMVTARLGRLPPLIEFNRVQISLFEKHFGETGFQMINGIPCLVQTDDKRSVPLTLISEYPDQTIYGGAFRAGHDVQTEFVLSAYEAYQQLAATP
ncbi:peptidase M14 (plasmid) [Sinorhizobium americanum CCGM7]|uniref:M14 family zinc carboxypeptidase n=1 Tax=Sinorhizobium americanum TaxID=194963 RepID=UPI0004D87AFA|nr:M14 family zinc carboxypeptidase [Sinorhizobium americanum]APG86935.1 peptidase M14 [Sinorhizobium americanum CCGM7]